MVAAKTARRQAHCLRWKSSPWDESHPEWQRLDRGLPADHPARLIDRAVDSLDLEPYLRLFCKGFGSPSWHPALLLKLALYEANRAALSPAEWHRDCTEHVPLIWLLRGARPSRATLYDCRRRLSPRLLKRLNRRALLAARSEGHCPARRASLDGTFTAARGSRHQLLNLKRLDRRLAILEQAVANDEATATDLGGPVQARPPRWLARSVKGRELQLRRYKRAREVLLQKRAKHQKQQSRRAKAKRTSPERVVVCPGEPCAAVGKDKAKVSRPLYDVQLLRDLDSPFILGYGVFSAATDAGLLPEMLVRAKALCGTLPERLLADAIYASVTDLLACRRRGVSLYAPVKQPGPSEPAKGAATAGASAARQPLPPPQGRQPAGPRRQPRKYYGKERFAWDEQAQQYTCPAGQKLTRVSSAREARVNGSAVGVQRYATKACAGCALRGECTTSKHGRVIKRLADEPLVEELRQRMASEEGKELYKLRKQTIELVFADLTEHRGLRRFHGFGLEQAETQVALLVLLHNLKALLRLRQTPACAAA
jgi:transposase